MPVERELSLSLDDLSAMTGNLNLYRLREVLHPTKRAIENKFSSIVAVNGVGMVNTGAAPCAGTGRTTLIMRSTHGYLMERCQYLLPTKGISTVTLDRNNAIRTNYRPDIAIEHSPDDYQEANSYEYQAE